MKILQLIIELAIAVFEGVNIIFLIQFNGAVRVPGKLFALPIVLLVLVIILFFLEINEIGRNREKKNKLIDKNEQQVQDVTARYEQQIQELKAKHQQEINELNARHTVELDKMQKDKADAVIAERTLNVNK